MGLLAARLRHRLTLESKVQTQDPTTGAVVTSWQTVDTIAAEVAPLSAREYLVGQQVDSKITTRITIRYRPDVTSDMRLLDEQGSHVYQIEGVLSDVKSGLEYLTLPCSEGVNDGR
jgi:SPP1 family predicted phage head-tail adaptor